MPKLTHIWNLPRLMNRARQLIEDINFQRGDLAHRLGRVEQFVLGDRFRPAAGRGVQVDALDQLHVVQQRVEGHKVGKAHPVAFGYL